MTGQVKPATIIKNYMESAWKWLDLKSVQEKAHYHYKFTGDVKMVVFFHGSNRWQNAHVRCYHPDLGLWYANINGEPANRIGKPCIVVTADNYIFGYEKEREYQAMAMASPNWVRD